MSQAPDEPELDAADPYLEAWEEVFRLHERGMSFSGRERNCTFLNLGGDGFADISAGSGLDFPDDGRGLAIVDWDQDGDLDLWLANRTAPRLRLLRNDAGAPASSIMVALTGTASNRDAIGARAELTVATADGGSRTLVRTLRAGEGFLSQSSKWLHFGLAAGAAPERLTIVWPSGARESFDGLAAGARLAIVEGRGRAEPARPRGARPDLSAESLAAPAPETPPRVLLVARAPVPPLEYETFEGRSEPIASSTDRAPLLVNLWATWCLPCVDELEAFRDRARDIDRAGLEILALSVDGLDEAKVTSAADARAFLAARDFPHESGMASPGLLERLQILNDRLFSLHLELAVPTSFLLDERGHLAAVYRGAVELDLLLEDARNLAAPLAQRRLIALPFPGRWLAEPQAPKLETLARRFAEEGHPAEAAYYLELAVESAPGDAALRSALAARLAAAGRHEAAVTHYRSALGLVGPEPGIQHALAVSLEELGRYEEALAAYAAALATDPGFVPTHLRLGTLALAAGDLGAAEQHLSAAATGAPNNGDALNSLAVVRLRQDRLEDAEQLLLKALAAQPSMAAAHNNLGLVLARRGRLDAARSAFERALELDPTLADARDNLQALDRR